MERFTKIVSIVPTALCLFLLPGVTGAQEDSVELSLNQCLMMALENNLELISARYSPQMADTEITAQQAGFDVGLEASASHNERIQAGVGAFSVTGSQTETTSVGVAQNLKFGADYSASFFAQEQVQAGSLITANTAIFSGIDLNFNLPLLRGFGTSVATEQLVLARNNATISRYDLQTTAERIIEQVEGAYWNVVAAREALRIEELALTRATGLLDQNRRMVEVGSLAPIEITQAEAGVASQDERVIVAETSLLDAEDELRRLMGVPEGDTLWEKSIRNLDAPMFLTHEVDLEQALATAMNERSELLSLSQVVRNRELSDKVARRELRRQLDFNAQYRPQGSSLDADPITMPPGNDANYGDAISAIPDLDEYTWQVGLTFRMAFGNRAAKATAARSALSLDQAETNLADQEQTVRVEVRRSVRGVESGMKRVEAAQANVVLQQRKLDAEDKKYENGMSTSFEVLTFQNDLATAQLAEVRARLDYIKALASLERVKGTLLASRGLSLGE